MRLLVYNVRQCVVPLNFNTEYSLSQRYNRVRLRLIRGAWVYGGVNYSHFHHHFNKMSYSVSKQDV